jgi:hypothetical protein
MKKGIRIMGLAIALGLIAALGLVAWIRLAPVDVARWHMALPTDTRVLDAASCADGVTSIGPGAGGRASCSLGDTPQSVLSRLDAIALASPRTRRIAGSPDEGRITWETRSRIMGFPDYTTAQASVAGAATRLDVISRQRIGEGDMGVNAQRLKDWLSQL